MEIKIVKYITCRLFLSFFRSHFLFMCIYAIRKANDDYIDKSIFFHISINNWFAGADIIPMAFNNISISRQRTNYLLPFFLSVVNVRFILLLPHGGGFLVNSFFFSHLFLINPSNKPTFC